jgi:hypothetical protein
MIRSNLEVGMSDALKTASFRVRKPLFSPRRPLQAGGRGCFPMEHIREAKQRLFYENRHFSETGEREHFLRNIFRFFPWVPFQMDSNPL